jgi:C-terminal processing protease CtpA/Prc
VLSTGFFKTDLGKSFNLAGIEPDVKIADSTSKTGEDPSIAKAESLLALPPLKAQASQNQTIQL